MLIGMSRRNCIILGSGRSGTSMVAGVIAGSGYFMGEDLHPPREANPKGFFEGPTIKSINEDLLALVVRNPPPWSRTTYGSRWLARIPAGTKVSANANLAARMAEAVEQIPFAYKDPRFCYTLDAWRPYLPNDVAFVCVFREPARTARSTLKEKREAPYLSALRLSFAHVIELWELMYARVLRLSDEGDWLFVHYDQILDGSAFDRLERHLGTPVDRTFPDQHLKRSKDGGPVSRSALDLYDELCARASYDPSSHGGPRRRAPS